MFCGLNIDLLIRPIRHRLEDRVKAHVLIRMLAYYVIWHMQRKLAPMLFKDDDPAAGRAARPGRPARRSSAAAAKAATKAPPAAGRYTASPPCSPPSPPTAFSPPAICPPSPSSPPDTGPAAGLRAARRYPPPRLPVVRQHQIPTHFRRQMP